MTTISAYDAKTHLSAYLERANRGEAFTITRHGQPVAVLSPVHGNDSAASAIENLRALRSELRLDGVTSRELIDEGRRW